MAWRPCFFLISFESIVFILKSDQLIDHRPILLNFLLPQKKKLYSLPVPRLVFQALSILVGKAWSLPIELGT